MRRFSLLGMVLFASALAAAESGPEADITKQLIPAQEYLGIQGRYLMSLVSKNGLQIIPCSIEHSDNRLFLHTTGLTSGSFSLTGGHRIPILFTHGGTSILIRFPFAQGRALYPNLTSPPEAEYFDVCEGSCPPNSAHFSGTVQRTDDPSLVPAHGLKEMAGRGEWIMTRVGDLDDQK